MPPGGRLTAQVGYGLTANLPGHLGSLFTSVTQGSALVAVVSGPTAALGAGQYTRFGTVVYLVDSFAGSTVTLATAYTGLTNAALTDCDYGVTVPARSAMAMTSASVDAFNTAALAKASYTITGLEVGVQYAVRLSARNDRGLSLPQVSVGLSPVYFNKPITCAAAQQKHRPAQTTTTTTINTATTATNHYSRRLRRRSRSTSRRRRRKSRAYPSTCGSSSTPTHRCACSSMRPTTMAGSR